MKLLTLADGYGDNAAVPQWYNKYWKWPEIIKLMTRGVELNNYSRYGAGNEFIVNQLKQNIAGADVALVQWTHPSRLDLVLDQDTPTYWDEVIANDPVYGSNIVDSNNVKFWLGSNTNASYICLKQHQLRSQIFVEYAKLLLEQHNIDYRFMLVDDSDYLNIDANWICHKPFAGMNSFKLQSKYRDLDLGIVQPLPLVAFDFIKHYVMPNIDLQWRNTRDINAVENMLYRHYQEAVKTRDDQI